jgi:hypothetical protein
MRQVVNVEPDMTERDFLAVLTAAQSPAAATAAAAVYQYCVNRRVSPAFLLALFQHESTFGTKGTATITHSWGNTRLPGHGGVGVVRMTTPTEARSGTFPVFRDWVDGGIATVARLVDYPPYQGKTTVEAIIPIWAPSSDGNDPARYVTAVLASMDTWTQTPPEAATMLTKPTVISKPSPNRNGYAGTRRVDAIVWHVTVGGLSGSLSWLTNPASAASSNYVIAMDGTIYELVPPTEDAWANGAVKAPDTSNPVIAKWLTENVNLNQRTVSVEHERLTSANEQPGGFTEAQHRSTVQLAAWLCQTFSIPPDRQHIIRHGQIDSVNRAHCPGLAESEMVAWIGEIAALVQSPPEQPQTKPTAPGMDSSAQTTGWYLNDRNECVVWANFGGNSTAIQGVNYADLGVTTTGQDGATYDRSIQAGEWQPWVKR